MRTTVLGLLAWSASHALVIAACASGSGGTVGASGGGFTSSVSGSSTVSKLSDADKRQLCADLAAYYTRNISDVDANRSRCASVAVGAGLQVQNGTGEQRRTTCKSTYDECLRNPQTTRDSTGVDVDKCASSKGVAGCAATVRDVGACYEEYVAERKASFAARDADCDRFLADGGLAQVTSDGADSRKSASCSSLQGTCPDLFD